MKFTSYILFFCSLFMIAQATAQSRKAGPINSGFVFVDGEYVEPPYTITSNNDFLLVNGIKIGHKKKSFDIELKNLKPKIPPCLERYSSPQEIVKCDNSKSNISYVKAACLYYVKKYEHEIANDSIIEYYKQLPNIENVVQKNGSFYTVSFFDGSELTMFFSVDRLKHLYPKDEKSKTSKELNNNLTNKYISYFYDKLEGNQLLFFFSDMEINDFLTTGLYNVDKIKNILDGRYSQQVKTDSLAGLLYKKNLVEKLVNDRSFNLKNNRLTNALNSQAANEETKTGTSLKNTLSGEIAYSPSRNRIKAFCPATYETNTFGMFESDEFENVKNEITACGFTNPTILKDASANNDDYGFDYYYLETLANDAGFIYVATHGDVDGGIMLTRGTSEDAIEDWITDPDDLQNIEISYIPDGYRPDEWNSDINCYEAYANSAWASDNWGNNLLSNHAITILSVCNGFNNGWVNACSGGACFGYDGLTDFTSANSHNMALLRNMNGTLNEGQYRLASEAYDRVLQGDPFSNFKYVGNEEVTLCPGIVLTLPVDETTVSSSGTGDITLDTWCNSDISLNPDSYLSPVYFDHNSDVQINDLQWDNPTIDGKSNRITFSWSNTSSQNHVSVTVYINAEKFQSTPSVLNEYHTLNTTVLDDSYSFLVNPYDPENDENLNKISGNVYDESTGENITAGTITANITEEEVIQAAINQQGEYEIFVEQGWSGDLTANAPGYTPETKNVSVFADKVVDFNLQESSVDFTYYSDQNVDLVDPPSVVAGTLLNFEEISSIATKWTYYFSWPGGEIAIVENHSDGGDGDITWETPYNANNPEIDLEVRLCVEYATPDDDGNSYCSNVKTIHLTDPTDDIVYYPDFKPLNNCNITQVGNVYKIQDASVPYNKVKNVKVWWDFISGEGYEIYGNESGAEVIPWEEGRIMKHSYNNIGHKTIKYQAEPHFQGDGGDLGYNSYIWGGVIVIDCDLTSTYSTENNKFNDAVRSDWVYENGGGPVYIYGGTFEFNGLANNYLSQKPTTISACNEIVIDGDVEFVADGENELVLEINDDPCLQGESKCAPIYPDNDKPEDDNKESKWHCYPNPVKNKLNVSVMLENKQDLHFRILNAQGQEIAYHNRKNVVPGKYLFQFDVSDYKPGMYIISINLNSQNKTQSIVKQ